VGNNKKKSLEILVKKKIMDVTDDWTGNILAKRKINIREKKIRYTERASLEKMYVKRYSSSKQ